MVVTRQSLGKLKLWLVGCLDQTEAFFVWEEGAKRSKDMAGERPVGVAEGDSESSL